MKRIYFSIFAIIYMLSGTCVAMTALGTPQKADYVNWRELPVAVEDGGPQLLLADSPEYVKQFGVTFSSSVTGDSRLFIHQVNDLGQAMRLSILVYNPSDAPVTLWLKSSLWSGPGFDYLGLGRQVMIDWLSWQSGAVRKAAQEIVIAGKQTVELDKKLSEQIFHNNDELMTGIFDWTTDAKVEVKVLACAAADDPLQFIKQAPILPADGVHPYGAFPAADRTLTAKEPFDSDGEPRRVSLGDNITDLWLRGTAGDNVVYNEGNYGLLYTLDIPTKGERPFDIYLAAGGGVYAGAVWLLSPNTTYNPVQTPYYGMWYGAEVAGISRVWYVGSSRGGLPLKMLWSPPGSANLPARLLLVPR